MFCRFSPPCLHPRASTRDKHSLLFLHGIKIIKHITHVTFQRILSKSDTVQSGQRKLCLHGTISIKHVRFNKIQHPSINRSCFSNKIFVTLKEFLVNLLRIFTENLKSGKHLPYLMLSLKKKSCFSCQYVV